MTPVFSNDRLVAFAANVANVSDIGGNLNRPLNREVYEEGLQIPLLRLCDAGRRVEPVWELILANVRTAEEVEGDLEAMIAGNGLAEKGINALLDYAGLDSLDDVSDAICDRSEIAMRKSIESLPDGTSESSWTADGFEFPIELRMEIEVCGREIYIRFPDAPAAG